MTHPMNTSESGREPSEMVRRLSVFRGSDGRIVLRSDGGRMPPIAIRMSAPEARMVSLSIDAALGAGQAEERWMAELTTSERRQLFWLASNPGSWGGHADRGDPLDDREMQRWLRLGFIELLEHVETRGKYKTKFGYFLTAAGRAALSRCVGERT